MTGEESIDCTMKGGSRQEGCRQPRPERILEKNQKRTLARARRRSGSMGRCSEERDVLYWQDPGQLGFQRLHARKGAPPRDGTRSCRGPRQATKPQRPHFVFRSEGRRSAEGSWRDSARRGVVATTAAVSTSSVEGPTRPSPSSGEEHKSISVSPWIRRSGKQRRDVLTAGDFAGTAQKSDVSPTGDVVGPPRPERHGAGLPNRGCPGVSCAGGDGDERLEATEAQKRLGLGSCVETTMGLLRKSSVYKRRTPLPPGYAPRRRATMASKAKGAREKKGCKPATRRNGCEKGR